MAVVILAELVLLGALAAVWRATGLAWRVVAGLFLGSGIVCAAIAWIERSSGG